MNLKTLLNHLKEESKRGVSHVYLDTEARGVIKSLVQKSQQSKQTSKPQPPQRVEEVSIRPEQTLSAPPSPLHQPPIQTSPPSAAPPEPAVYTPTEITLPAGDKIAQLRYLKELCKNWLPPAHLQNFKRTLVFAKGNPDAKIILVGDAPGFYEERVGHPFKGKSGEKLDQILKAMGLSRSQVYVTNICKLRPSLPGQTTNNRKPTASEMSAWLPILEQEFAIVRPQCIIALGSTAAEGLLSLQNQLVGKLRGEWFQTHNIPLRVTFHPSYLLRNANNNTEKRKLWEDMLAVMEHIHLPISDKQRRFFT